MAYLHGRSKACPDIGIDAYVRNLTSSYVGKSDEAQVEATSVLMLMVAAGFLALSLFSRVANLSSVHHPHARLLLSGAISLFLPIMSYLFSEAKMMHEYMESHSKDGRGDSSIPELSPRAREILIWMLLVELLRRKVEAVNLVGEGIQRYIGFFINGATVAWLGYLVFANVKGTGQVTIFGFLWIVCATKWLQRFVFAKVLKHSFSHDKNAWLVSSYMDQMLQLRQGVPGSSAAEKLKTCEYVVMGEEKLVTDAAGPWGYMLHDLDKVSTVVTVGRVWRLANVEVEEGDPRPLLKSIPSLKRLCLSMALFKLLRRSIERVPAMAKEETDDCRGLILQGLFQEDQDGGSQVLEVLNNEVDFLSEYYHSVHPVVLASPYFFLVNYLVLPVVVCCLCATTTILSGSGNVLFAFHAIKTDNYAIRYGIFRLLGCLLERALTSPQAFFPAIDVIISYLLFTAFFLEILIEFVVFFLSNWFMVSLVCSYVAKSRWRHRSIFPGAIRFISWARRTLRHPSIISFKQFSVLSTFSWHPVMLPSAYLPSEAKPSLVKRFRLAAYGHDEDEDGLTPVPLSKGHRALEMPGRAQYMHLSWFCNNECVAEVIVTWHIATTLLEMKHPQGKRNGRPDVVATRLSNYCTYLVVCYRELLPGHQEGTKRVLNNMKTDLKKELGLWGYHFSSKRALHNKMMMLTPDNLRPDNWDDSMTAVQKGIVLGKALIEASSKGNDQHIWELVADVWVELIVYVAPSSGDEHVKGHERALARGTELVTLLWALATHTGIARPPRTGVSMEMVSHGICSA